MERLDDILKRKISAICITNDCIYENVNNVFYFTVRNGSNSVKLVYDYMAELWYIEVFPIDQNTDISTIHFNDETSAIKAFSVWKQYYQLVVTENFKMF